MFPLTNKSLAIIYTMLFILLAFECEIYHHLRNDREVFTDLVSRSPVARKPTSSDIGGIATLLYEVVRGISGKPPGLHGLSLRLPEGFGGDTEGCTAYASARMARAIPSCDMTGKDCSPKSAGLLRSVPEKGCHANKSGSASQRALAVGG